MTTMASTPFSDDIIRIVPRNDVSNDQVKDLSSQMVGVKYKPPINVEESEDPYILLDLIRKSKQLTFSNTPLWPGTMKAVFENQKKN